MPTTPSATIAIRAGIPLSLWTYPITVFLLLGEAASSAIHSGTSLAGAARQGQQGVAGAEPVEQAGLVVLPGGQRRREPHDDHRQHVLDVDLGVAAGRLDAAGGAAGQAVPWRVDRGRGLGHQLAGVALVGLVEGLGAEQRAAVADRVGEVLDGGAAEHLSPCLRARSRSWPPPPSRNSGCLPLVCRRARPWGRPDR